MQPLTYTPVIYKITSPSGKVYIGQTRRLKMRISAYKNMQCKKQRLIYNSLKKYGWANHTFKIIHELPVDISQIDLDNYEILYWELYLSIGSIMLNIRQPGSRGVITDEIKSKISLNSYLKDKSKIGTRKFKVGSFGYNFQGLPF